jgi:hypothetical protein
MKALSAKSKSALLVFFSVITLTLVLSLAFTPRFVRSSKTHQAQVLGVYISQRQIRKVLPAQFNFLVFAAPIAFLWLATFLPWTGTIRARAPPR